MPSLLSCALPDLEFIPPVPARPPVSAPAGPAPASCSAEYERLRRVIGATGQLLYDCDLRARRVLWEGVAERLMGYSLEELHQIDLADWGEHIHPEERAQTLARFREAVAAARPFRIQYRFRRKDGSYATLENNGVCTANAEGRTVEVMGLITDVTERIQIEARLQQAQRLESIGVLAGGIAHDLNNVLSPIMIACQLLELEEDSPEHKRLLGTIRLSTQRGAELVKQVLSFCRGMASRRIEVQPRHIIKELVSILKETLPKSIQIETRLPDDLWLIPADPTQIRQVLLNLCVNARDAMPRGGRLLITAENLVRDNQYAALDKHALLGPHVLISVSDDGTGIPPELQSRIFDPFFTTKEPGKGTGLGLSTSLAIAKSHGGSITVYSEPNRGSTFKVYLPALCRCQAASGNAEAAAFPRGRGELILVVDDEAAVRAIIAQTLESFGYRVLTAANGAEAQAMYARASHEVALVLTDLIMPVMDGLATLHALRRINPEFLAIVFSGFGPEGEAMQQTPNVRAFLSKPFSAETLLRAMDRLLHPGDSTAQRAPAACASCESH